MRALDSSRSAVPVDLAKGLAVFICCSAVFLTSCTTRKSCLPWSYLRVPRVSRLNFQTMKFGLSFCLALVLSGVLFGCSTGQHLHNACGHPSVRFAAKGLNPNLPIKFASYCDVYGFIAECEGIPTNADALLKLAAESKMEITPIENVGTIQIIEANYYGDVFNEIRGAQLNGRYYVLRKHKSDFALVGILEGNLYRWENVGKSVKLKTHWHVGLGNGEDDWQSYEWNGQTFGAIAPASLPSPLPKR